MKEKTRELKADKPVKPKFISCEKEWSGGMWKPGGSECHGGTLVYRAMYNGRLERFAKDCQCLVDWRQG